MSEIELPNIITPISAFGLFRALKANRRNLSDAVAALFTAHISLETAGGRSIHCWNLGNAKCHVGDGRTFTQFSCTEVYGGVVEHFAPPSPQCRFRAFSSLDEAIEDYLSMLERDFPWAFACALEIPESAGWFAICLAVQRYYTASPQAYANMLSTWLDRSAGLASIAALGFGSVEAFQSAASLTPDGVIGPATKAAIEAAQEI